MLNKQIIFNIIIIIILIISLIIIMILGFQKDKNEKEIIYENPEPLSELHRRFDKFNLSEEEFILLQQIWFPTELYGNLTAEENDAKRVQKIKEYTQSSQHEAGQFTLTGGNKQIKESVKELKTEVEK